jgi:hypothetical protein
VSEIYDPEKSLERQIRAFHWVRLLAELPGRLAGAPTEREAADRVESWIRELGVDEVARAPVPSRPRPGWSMALHLGLGALGCWWGGFLGTALSLIAAISYRRELGDGPPGLSRWVPAPPSVNVVGRAGAREPRHRVVLSAHIDGPQAGWLFSERVAGLLWGPLPGPLVLAHGLLFVAVGLALATWLGAGGFLLGAARLLVGGGLALGAAAGVEWALARPSPAANGNASGVAALLTCAEQLLAQLPEDAELWIVGTGAGEVGACGMRAFLDEHPDWAHESTCFLNFERVGGGDLHWVRSEGTLARISGPPMLAELARRVAASGVFGQVTPTDLPIGTDGREPARLGYPTLSIVSLEAGGAPSHHRRADDLPEALDMAAVIRSADFAASVAWASLRGEAGPLAIL